MKAGISSVSIRSGRTHISSAYSATSSRRRFGEACVVISEGAKRSRSILRNQSIVFLSVPAKSI